MQFSMVDVISVSSAIVSILLAVIAIWQAVYFYTQGKNTESRVETALESIKTEVNTLKAFNAKTLDRLVKHVTSPGGEFEQTIEALNKKFDNIPNLINNIKIPTVQAATSPKEQEFRLELLNAYIIIWNYTAATNVWASQCLPNINEFDESNGYHALIKKFVDRSYADFNYITDIVNRLDIKEITSPNIIALYEEVKTLFTSLIGDTSQQFIRKSKTS